MTPTLVPAPPFVLYGVEFGPVWTVVRDGVAIGEIRRDGSLTPPWYLWRVPGGWWQQPWTGEREAAIAALERAAGRPMPARRGIPAELRIAGLMKEQATRGEASGE